jgi:hypothetical protein
VEVFEKRVAILKAISPTATYYVYPSFNELSWKTLGRKTPSQSKERKKRVSVSGNVLVPSPSPHYPQECSEHLQATRRRTDRGRAPKIASETAATPVRVKHDLTRQVHFRVQNTLLPNNSILDSWNE